jgi:hypothetical protein
MISSEEEDDQVFHIFHFLCQFQFPKAERTPPPKPLNTGMCTCVYDDFDRPIKPAKKEKLADSLRKEQERPS